MQNNNFYSLVISKLVTSLSNNYEDNFDYLRFGKPLRKKKSIKDYIKGPILKNNYINRHSLKSIANSSSNLIENYLDDFNWLYNLLNNSDSKSLLIDLTAYQVLGYRFVKLPINTINYWTQIKAIENLADKDKKIHLDFMNWSLFMFDLKSLGYNFKLFSTTLGVMVDFVLEQYAYKSQNITIEAKPGDIVIEGGGCYGDTSLYFASKVGSSGKVFSFEFIPKNLAIFEQNVDSNPSLKESISIIRQPLWDSDDKEVYYEDNGPGSKISFEKLDNASGKTKTITIDTFVEKNKIEKLNFIKMDIEGAEPNALKGALNTILRFKPNLAITIYHSLDDFTKIPRWIHNLNLGYKLYLGHYTIYNEETVLFATIE